MRRSFSFSRNFPIKRTYDFFSFCRHPFLIQSAHIQIRAQEPVGFLSQLQFSGYGNKYPPQNSDKYRSAEAALVNGKSECQAVGFI
jgi:hypothetical protein